MKNKAYESLRGCIHELVNDISTAVSSSDLPRVHQVCKILHPQLLRIKQEFINGNQLVDFLYCLQIVDRWSVDIRGALFEEWPNVAACILGVIDVYEENDCSDAIVNFVNALLGDEFLKFYGKQFACEVVYYFSEALHGKIEEKRQIISSLWRYYERDRKVLDGAEGSCGKYIGAILNNLSIRHENDKQWTSEFLKTHTEGEYERLLDSVMILMVNAFARRNISVNVEPLVKSMLCI